MHDHMHHMDHVLTAPTWVIFSLSALFGAGFLFYLYRLLFRDTVRAALGYSDWENEVGHGLCMLAMASAMAPVFLQLPPMLLVGSLAVTGVWFIVRALTWGKTLTNNKAWYDWVHVGMLFGMALMFLHINLGVWFTALLLAFWGWFTAYYAYQVFLDMKNPRFFSVGADFAHFAMGAVMFLMTLFPGMLMSMPMDGGAMHHDHGAAEISQPLPLPMDDQSICRSPQSPAASLADDSTFDSHLAALAGTRGTVFVMFQGGCDKCAAEAPLFEEVAAQYTDKAGFIRLRLDQAPTVAARYGIDKCPAILCIEKGSVKPRHLTEAADRASIEAFVKANL